MKLHGIGGCTVEIAPGQRLHVRGHSFVIKL